MQEAIQHQATEVQRHLGLTTQAEVQDHQVQGEEVPQEVVEINNHL